MEDRNKLPNPFLSMIPLLIVLFVSFFLHDTFRAIRTNSRFNEWYHRNMVIE